MYSFNWKRENLICLAAFFHACFTFWKDCTEELMVAEHWDKVWGVEGIIKLSHLCDCEAIVPNKLITGTVFIVICNWINFLSDSVWLDSLNWFEGYLIYKFRFACMWKRHQRITSTCVTNEDKALHSQEKACFQGSGHLNLGFAFENIFT